MSHGLTVRIGAARRYHIQNAGKVDIDAVDESAQVGGELVYYGACVHLHGAHAYTRKIQPQLAVLHINAEQGGGLIRGHIIQLEADHVQIHVRAVHSAVEGEHEVDADGCFVLFGNQIKGGIAEVDQAAHELFCHAQQVEALLFRRVRGDAEGDGGGEHFVQNAGYQLGGIVIFIRALLIVVLVDVLGDVFGDGLFAYLAAQANACVEREGDVLAAQRAVRYYPNGFFVGSSILFAQAHGHFKVHGGNARGDIRRHQREQAEYGLRGDDELQLGRIYRKIVVVSKPRRCQRLRRHLGHGEHYALARLGRGEFEAVISVAFGVLCVDGYIIALCRYYGISALRGMSGGSFIIGHFCAGYCGFTALRAVDNVEFHIVADIDIVERYFKVYFFIRTHGHLALIGQIKHTVAVVIHIRNGAFKLHEVAFHKLAHFEVVHFIYGELNAEYGDRAEVDHEDIFTHRDGDRRALLDHKAVARNNSVLARTAEGYAVREGELNHKAAVVDICLVECGIYAQVEGYFRRARFAHFPDEFVTQIFGYVIGQERSDDFRNVIVAAFEGDIQFCFYRKSAREDGSHAFYQAGAVEQIYLPVIARFSADGGYTLRGSKGEPAGDGVALAIVYRSVFIHADGEVCAALEDVEVGDRRVHKGYRSAAREGGDEFGENVARNVEGDEVALDRERGEQRGDGIHYSAGNGG